VKKGDSMAVAADNIAKVVDSRTKFIANMTGMSEIQVVKLAQTMGVNLADNTAEFREQLEQLGVTVVKTKEQINQTISELVTKNLSVFDQAIKLDEVMKNFRMDFNARGAGATVTSEDAKLLYGTAFEQLTNMYGGNSVKAFFELQRQMGSQTGLAFNERNASGKLNPLGGLGGAMFTGIPGQAVTDFLNMSERDVATTLTTQFGAILAGGNKALATGDVEKLKKAFLGMDTDMQELFANSIASGDLGGLSATEFLSSFGVSGVSVNTISDKDAAFALADAAEKELMLMQSEKDIIDGMGKFFGPEAENPEWWSKAALTEVFKAAGIDGDTKTPRGRGIGDTTSSRLSQTMARHMAIDGMVSGSRTITSAYRTNNLGSLNSDHLTGRAYDLVGQQLGMYKTTVEKSGGFAEYHGRGGNRHLHVVPGPGISAPMGDMTVPASKKMTTTPTQMSSGGGDITVNLNVNGLGIKEALPQIKSELERSIYEMRNRS
jgi:hypothetical protein